MGTISDLHIHSRYSRACSKNINIENLSRYAKIKGLNLLGTGDFTHPEWIKELKEKLKEKNKGIYEFQDINFLLSTEISLMYKQEKQRKVHFVLLAPNFDIVHQINKWLLTKGRLDYDGRPIFGFSCIELADKLREIDKDIEIIPAHVWTPYFGIFGSMSGFDSLKEAFQDRDKQIHAIETGMSSDPKMNWKISSLNNKSLISFSDAHSFWPWRLGREATIFKGDNLEYKEIIKQIRENSFESTIETNPAYGKYHFDGHAVCKFSCSPEESKKNNDMCPVCKGPLTIGVDNRVNRLADNPENFKPNKAKPFYTLLPLHEIISMAKGTPLESKLCWGYYNRFIQECGNEFEVLLNLKKEKLAKIDDKIAEAIILNREGKIKVIPGYDGEYGKVVMRDKQMTLI